MRPTAGARCCAFPARILQRDLVSPHAGVSMPRDTIIHRPWMAPVMARSLALSLSVQGRARAGQGQGRARAGPGQGQGQGKARAGPGKCQGRDRGGPGQGQGRARAGTGPRQGQERCFYIILNVYMFIDSPDKQKQPLT